MILAIPAGADIIKSVLPKTNYYTVSKYELGLKMVEKKESRFTLSGFIKTIYE